MNLQRNAVKLQKQATFRGDVMSGLSSTGQTIEQVLLYALG